uniref:Uncharacterized protein n=1 Tax=Amphimedon queenslandica TaxID=400682 RepID=A0A1X7VUQ2_AMPQE
MVKPGLIHWIAGLGLGGISGVYLAQNYQLPLMSDLFDRLSKFVSSFEKGTNSSSSNNDSIEGRGGPNKP